jgi:hypothetical protein
MTIREKLTAKGTDMKRAHFIFFTLLFLLIGLTGSFAALAGSDFRCSGRIIAVGDSQDYVLDKCGEPTSIEDRTEGIASGFRHSNPESHEELNYVMTGPQVEVWTYNFGRTQFIRYLTFRSGELAGIETGGYGY